MLHRQGTNQLHSRGTCSDLQKWLFVALLWPKLRTAQQLIWERLVFSTFSPAFFVLRPWKLTQDNLSLYLFLQGPLVRWLKVNFSEAFIAWIHIKALRVFVESVLRCSLQITQLFPVNIHKLTHLQLFERRLLFSFRYGLPVNFQAMLLQPNKKTMKRLREVLNDLYKHLDSSAAAIIDVSNLIIFWSID